MKRRATKILLPVLAAGTVTAAVAVSSSCAAITNAIIDTHAKDISRKDLRQNDPGPENTPYPLADSLTYSLVFENGEQGSSQTFNYGTGWLFDYETDGSAGKWVGYFGTNLHVGQFAQTAKNPTAFFLGKRQPLGADGSLSAATMRYVQLQAVPTLQYASAGFYAAAHTSFVDFAVLRVTVDFSGVFPGDAYAWNS